MSPVAEFFWGTCLAVFLLGCREKEPRPWWWDASFHHDVNPCDDPPPTEREVALGYDDLCGPREAARIKASMAEWKAQQALLDAGPPFHCVPPDDAWVVNPDGTCRLVR